MIMVVEVAFKIKQIELPFALITFFVIFHMNMALATIRQLSNMTLAF